MTDRYTDKPFLKLLDAYVLDAIGHLDDKSDAQLTAAEPALREAFGGDSDWRSIVVERMQFPEGIAGAIREVWEKGAVRFREEQGHEPDPAEFTRIFNDTNFPH
ncbi:hypothetical protein [uncultured Sphingomonas sp.]|uniref:hypothetical protein n=1 Tax=uncultured Sphingomonas sp. TaxID=158754 RepID=UPI0025FD30B1|nr:hypothetical protein [uncultured Sphingomonas sp.]